MSRLSHEPMEPPTRSELAPMPLWQSTMLFLGSGGVAALSIYAGVPWLVEHGFDLPDAMLLASVVLFGWLLTLTLALYLGEGRSLRWTELKTRLRIKNITLRDWLWVGVGVLIVDASFIGLQFTVAPILETMPDWVAAPHRTENAPNRAGDYLALVGFSALIALNVISEELLWRGYILPRQELCHGRNTWWVHGVQWACFHWFKPWAMIPLLPGALVYGRLSTRTRSLIPGLVLHFGLNGLGILLLALEVFG